MEVDETTLTEEEGKEARSRVVSKAIRYSEDRPNRTWSQDNVFTRRRNLVAHLGVDETTSRQEVQRINQHSSRMLPAFALQSQRKSCSEIRYKCSKNCDLKL